MTPEMVILDLIEKGGLFWLKWQKAIDPLTQRADYEKYCADVAAEGGATGLADSRTAAVLSASSEHDVGRVESQNGVAERLSSCLGGARGLYHP